MTASPRRHSVTTRGEDPMEETDKEDSEEIDEFENLIKDSFGRELDPLTPDKDAHPSPETMYQALSGKLPARVRAQLSTHISGCSRCRSRWRRLSQVTEQEKQALTEAAQMPSFAHLSDISKQKEPPSLLDRLRKMLPGREAFRPLVLVPTGAAIVLALALAITVPLLIGPGKSQRQIEKLTEQIQKLSNKVDRLSATTTLPTTIKNKTTFGPQLSTKELSSLLDRVDHIKGTWQRALTITSFLDRHRISVPDRFDWTRLSPYQVKSETSWNKISRQVLGRSDLWPLLYLINGGDRELETGESILVPSTDKK